MKKLISVVAATAVTISAFSSFASAANLYSYYDDPDSFTADELNNYNVPKEDYVPVGLSVGLTWDGGDAYRSTISKSFSYTQTATVADTTFDARAQLDMVNVAREWEAVLNKAANNDAARRAAAIDNVTLSASASPERNPQRIMSAYQYISLLNIVKATGDMSKLSPSAGNETLFIIKIVFSFLKTGKKRRL